MSCTLGLAIEQLFHFVGVGHLAELFGKLLVLGEQCPRGGDRFLDVAEDVFIRVEVRLLLQEADGEAFGELGLAVEVLIDAGHDPQQRALAGAVAAQDADLRAGVEREPDIFEDFALANLLGQPLTFGKCIFETWLMDADEAELNWSLKRPVRR